MNRTAKVIHVPVVPDRRRKEYRDQKRSSEQTTKVVKQAETAKREDKPPAVEAKQAAVVVAKVDAESIELSPYQIGYETGYEKGSKDGATRAIQDFVATVEQKLATHDGYKDPEEWRKEAKIPSWWIAVLITHLGHKA